VGYGELVQLRHTLSGMFLRVSSEKASKIGNMEVVLELSKTSDRASRFIILPRIKVCLSVYLFLSCA
jgi:hypothetical protein